MSLIARGATSDVIVNSNITSTSGNDHVDRRSTTSRWEFRSGDSIVYGFDFRNTTGCHQSINT